MPNQLELDRLKRKKADAIIKNMELAYKMLSSCEKHLLAMREDLEKLSGDIIIIGR